MVTQRTEGLYRVFLFCQILLVAALFWFGVWIMVTFYSPSGGQITWRSYSIYCVLLIFGIMIESLARDGSKNYLLQNELLRQHRLALRQTFMSTAALVVYLIAMHDTFISRVFFFNFVPWLYVVLLFSHHYLPSFLARGIFKDVRMRALLIGSAEKAGQLRGWLRRKGEIGLSTVGLLTDEPIEKTSDGVPVLGTSDAIERVVRERGISQVILLEFPLFTEVNRNIIRVCDQLGVRLLIVSDLEEKLRHPVTHFEDDGFRFIGLREEPLENPLNRFFKRAIDVLIALPVMLLVFPMLTIIVWLAQRLQSPGPLFHVQTRAGMQNRRFRIFKFRTMHPENADIAQQAVDGDKRVYGLGKWFRKLSIDEVPQFWNVLRGEMSIVGPRPHLIEHNNEFSQLMENYHIRTLVKPGITGLAQVRGFRGEAKSNSDIEKRVACDIEYLENWNLSLECGIILRTCAQLFLPPPTAY